MADLGIARRWAAALLDLASDEGKIDELGAELAAVTEGFGPAGIDALSNPVFTQDERRVALDAILKKAKVGGITANTLRLMLDKGRFALLPQVAEVYRANADERAGRTRVVIDTAFPLTPQLEGEIRAALEKATGSTVVLEARVNESLIGGLVVRVGSKVYDASVRTRLRDLQHRLTSSQVPAEA
ncbi:MAG: ATP synthase F1 subunit delta [Deltaproteobacteria bacterium]|nr:MAG: ATP synthase F1 subunit delta [Deltaproteobacteria bacterium]